MGNPLAQLLALLQGSSYGPSRERLMTGQPRGDELVQLLGNLSPDDIKMGTMPMGPRGVASSVGGKGVVSAEEAAKKRFYEHIKEQERELARKAADNLRRQRNFNARSWAARGGE